MIGRKSKLLQSLEESVMPIDQEDTVRMIAEHIRQPLMDPFEQSRLLASSKDENLSVLHLADAIKFRDTMKSFKISPTAEALDEVMPVKNKDLDEMLELLIDDEDEDEDDEEEEDDEDEDEDTEGVGDDDVEDQDDRAEVTKEPHILRKWLDRFKMS
ncbi:uncharacterized protein Dana_GF27105 [Drosophila ananassae]|uniref:Uncharacterized protein n=1 Tax=Drosophila ananassae TaxID=7217 RepID=A0A0P9BMY3_DROAN|nr:nonsense-mediated mRNA decay protein 2 [Drosophila ananassae]KPU73159.1 uncharacterized protein Dana_GF27105 [Drosophila ananassae]